VSASGLLSPSHSLISHSQSSSISTSTSSHSHSRFAPSSLPPHASFSLLSPNMSDHDQSPGGPPPPAEAPQPPSEHLNIKVTDGNNEVFFKIKRSTKLEKLMNAFCERQGKQISTVRFLFDGQRVSPTDSPDTVSLLHHDLHQTRACCAVKLVCLCLRLPRNRLLSSDVC